MDTQSEEDELELFAETRPCIWMRYLRGETAIGRKWWNRITGRGGSVPSMAKWEAEETTKS